MGARQRCRGQARLSLQTQRSPRAVFDLDQIVNYVTPGYATAVFVSASGVERIRTTAESHRRIAIIEVMGRHSGYIALGTAYGQPDIILVPEHPLDLERLVERVKHIYDLQKNVVIVCGEGIVDEQGRELGAETKSTDPAGNMVLSGAAEALRAKLIQMIGDRYFQLYRRGESAKEAIFTRKVGHTQRGGRPILFDRFYAALLGAKAVDLLLEGRNNAVSILQYNSDQGFSCGGLRRQPFPRPLGPHPRPPHAPDLYDPKLMKPSKLGIDYLLPIFTDAIGNDDMEHMRQTLVRSRQPGAALPLDQHGHPQAHPLFGNGGAHEFTPPSLIPYINVKLALLGFQPAADRRRGADSPTSSPSLVAQYREKERLLANHLCPADQRIQNFLYDYLQDVPVTKLPLRTFVLDRPGMARAAVAAGGPR